MEKKSNKGLIIIIVILIIMILGLGSYIVYDKFISNQDDKKIEEKEESKKEEVTILEDTSKPFVYDNEKYTYLGVPYINLNTADGIKFNKEIIEFIGDYEDTKEFTDNATIAYTFYENDDLVSVIIKKTTVGSSGLNKYLSINFDKKEGKEIDNKAILLKKGIKETELADKLVEAYDNQINQEDYSYTYKTQYTYDDNSVTIYDGSINKIKNNKVEDYVMYLNSNGELVVVTEVYFIAGPEIGNVLINLDTKLYEKR